MSLMADALIGERIEDVLIDSEVVYVTLANGTVITIRGLIAVEPRQVREPNAALGLHGM